MILATVLYKVYVDNHANFYVYLKYLRLGKGEIVIPVNGGF
jgi:hypothetical protein